MGMKGLVIHPLHETESRLEVVEHKGIGHPDTICDAVAEELGLALSRFYVERFGRILHYNVDKALLAGGVSRPAFGGGEILRPMELFLAGRATRRVGDVEVPIAELAENACRSWMRGALHGVDPDRHVVVRTLVQSGSGDLVDLHRRSLESETWLCNDTSYGTGYAPLSELERVVLAVADELEAASKDPASPECGEDSKIMGIGSQGAIDLTVACAFIGRYLPDISEYERRRSLLRDRLYQAARRLTDKQVQISVNAADDFENGAVFLTVSGTSAECGDDGQVGRGNRINRLITACRPMTLEAAAGKNPVSHVGKLYQLMAHLIAQDAVASVNDVERAYCTLVGRIGAPVNEPAAAEVRLSMRENRPIDSAIEASVEEIVRSRFSRIEEVREAILRRALRVF
jgi:S-adenosylmethionine synthetase